jgi:peptide chain release factor 2
MLIDDLKEQVKHIEPTLEVIKNYWDNAHLEQEHARLTALTEQENFWQHPEQAKISQALQQLRLKKERYDALIKAKQEVEELLELFGTDEQELQKIATDIKELSTHAAAFKIALLLDKPEDNAPCFLSINAGAGGTESQDWANILMRMTLRFCEREGFKVAIMDYQPGEEAGIKSTTLYIKGENAYGLLKSEHGIHRLVRISPFDASKRRHTSFAAITITPETPDIAVEINQQDLRIDTYRSGGAGGQHVNKTESAVRITHLPSGIVTQCQSERSQVQNKETALKMLKAKLAQKIKEEQEAKIAAGVEKKKIEWGSQIRSYILHPYKMVKDHRTDYVSQQPDLVLDGDLIPFIESYLLFVSQKPFKPS